MDAFQPLLSTIPECQEIHDRISISNQHPIRDRSNRLSFLQIYFPAKLFTFLQISPISKHQLNVYLAVVAHVCIFDWADKPSVNWFYLIIRET